LKGVSKLAVCKCCTETLDDIGVVAKPQLDGGNEAGLCMGKSALLVHIK
jgi:hypothetical protein